MFKHHVSIPSTPTLSNLSTGDAQLWKKGRRLCANGDRCQASSCARDDLQDVANASSLDLSFNNIRHVPSLPSFTKVNVMYLVQNKIGKVDEGVLDWAKDTLTSLELGGNRIRVCSRCISSERSREGFANGLGD